MFRLFYTSIYFLLLNVPVKLHGMGIFQILLSCTYFFCLGILTLEDDTTKRQGLKCINSMVWVRCPRHKHHGVKVVRCAVASAICHFHSGSSSRLRIMERPSIPGGASIRLASNSMDNKRKRKSDLQATEKEKKCRQGEQLLRTRREEALRDAEGDTYDAGGF